MIQVNIHEAKTNFLQAHPASRPQGEEVIIYDV